MSASRGLCYVELATWQMIRTGPSVIVTICDALIVLLEALRERGCGTAWMWIIERFKGKNSSVDVFYLDAWNSNVNTLFLQTPLQLVSTMEEKIFVMQYCASVLLAVISYLLRKWSPTSVPCTLFFVISAATSFRFCNGEFINWWSIGAKGPRSLISVILEVFTHFNTGGRELPF
jgi:hypothetical protein